MPERIFAWPYKQAYQGVSLAGGKPDEMREYRRADLPPTDEQIMEHPKVVALVDAAERLESDITAQKNGLNPAPQSIRVNTSRRALIAALRDLKGGE